MFERFTRSARECVIRAQTVAAEAGDQEIRTDHLLLAALEVTDPVHGLHPDRVRAALRELCGTGGEIDEESLAGLGIDLDRVRERVEQTFGAGALDGPGESRRRGGFWRRADRGGHLRFTGEAKAVLERSLREVLDLGVREITGDAILLAVLHPESGIAHRAVARSGHDVPAVAGRLRERMRRVA